MHISSNPDDIQLMKHWQKTLAQAGKTAEAIKKYESDPQYKSKTNPKLDGPRVDMDD